MALHKDSEARTVEALDFFEESIAIFQESLSDDQKLLFQPLRDADVMMQNIQQYCQKIQSKKLVAAGCLNIKRFADILAPYFDIIGLFVSSNPKYAAIAWGAVRLVFQLSAQFVSFFEKLAEMLVMIASRLPLYGDHIARITHIENTMKSTPNRTEHRVRQLDTAAEFKRSRGRLMASLSLVYSDILQFCQRSCSLFCSQKGKPKSAFIVISTLMWKPFDTHFSDILKNIENHSRQFEKELNLRAQLDELAQLERLSAEVQNTQAGVNALKRGLNRFTKRSSESDSQTSQQMGKVKVEVTRAIAETSKIYSEQQKRLNAEMARLKAMDAAKREEEERKAQRDKIWQLKRWLNAPDFTKDFEKAQRSRLPGTGEWLAEDQTYCKWAKQQWNHNSEKIELHPRTLSIIATPGFGKTVLSGHLIEDLRLASLGKCSAVKDQLDSKTQVAFFHFNAENPDLRAPTQAFRALVEQFLHSGQSDINIIDAATTLMDGTGHGHETASEEEVLQILQLVLQTRHGIILVVDGVDECFESDVFLSILADMGLESCCRIVLLCRPNISHPKMYDGRPIIRPGSNKNLKDIANFLSPAITDLLARRLIAGSLNHQEIVDKLTAKANGMFLWASLMIKYLRCHFLTPWQRLDAINRVNLLEGLDAIYSRIIDDISKISEEEKATLQQLFHLLSCNLRPLRPRELQEALAVRADGPRTEDHCIQDFETSLALTCGALVEIRFDGMVAFIHLSLRDFLAKKHQKSASSRFHVDINRAHFIMATACLSELAHNIPELPADSSCFELQQRPSFLLYAANFWRDHVFCAFAGQYTSTQTPNESMGSPQQLICLISFLLLEDQIRTTKWVECSWALGIPPELPNIERYVYRLEITDHSSETLPDIARILDKLHQLSKDLRQLKEDYGYLLSKEPYKIWGPEITAFNRSDFWVSTPFTKVTKFSRIRASKYRPRRQEDVNSSSWIFVASAVAEDGCYIGMISVLPSEYFATQQNRNYRFKDRPEPWHQKTQSLLNVSEGWQSQYQIWSLKDKKKTFQAVVDLHSKDVFEILYEPSGPLVPFRFQLPVAFGSDLQQVVILRSIITLLPFDASANKSNDSHYSRYDIPFEVPPISVRRLEHHMQKVYHLQFSPDSRYLLVCIWQTHWDWEMQVWTKQADTDTDTTENCFRLVNRTRASTMDIAQSQFVFHSDQPLLIYTTFISTWIWEFSKTSSNPKPLCNYPLPDMVILPCGRSVYSQQAGETPIDIQSWIGALQKDASAPTTDTQSTVSGQSKQDLISAMAGSRTTYNQDIGAVSFGIDGSTGKSHMSVVQNHAHDGAIVKHKLHADGSTSSDLLAHLPQWAFQDKDTKITLLNTEDSDQWLRMVLHSRERLFYTLQDRRNQPPILIERDKSSILPYNPPRRISDNPYRTEKEKGTVRAG